MPLDPRVLLICALLAGGVYAGTAAVQSLKKLGHKIVHVLHHEHTDPPADPPQP